MSGFNWFLTRYSRSLSLVCCCLLFSLLVSACSLPGMDGSSGSQPGTQPTTAATAKQVPLAQLRWCGKPFIVFRDKGAAKGTATPASSTATPSTPAAGTPVTIDDWEKVKAELGFTVYLPSTLPEGSCLVSVYGTMHDPILGGNFIIGYVLADGTSIGLSQAPVSDKNTSFQCNLDSRDTATKDGGKQTAKAPLQICSGAREKTNIVLSARGETSALQQFFNALQPDVNWLPTT